jgi:hypothetical protein
MIDEATRLIVRNLIAITALAFSPFQGVVTTTLPQRFGSLPPQLGSRHAAILRNDFQLMVRLVRNPRV